MQPIRVSIEETEQPIRSREILKFCAQSMREFSHGWNPAGRSKTKDSEENQKSHSGYRDLAIGIRGIQY